MITANEAREAMTVDIEQVNFLEENACAAILKATNNGERHATLYIYDRAEGRYLGDITESVIEVLEKRFIAAGYELDWKGIPFTSCVARVVRW